MTCLRIILAATFYAAAYGQPAAPQAEIDRAWNAIKDFGRPSLSRGPNGENVSPASRSERAAVFLNRSAQAKVFYNQNPGHAFAAEARRIEVVCLAWAALNGDVTQDANRTSLVEQVRNDKRLAPEKRSEAVAWNLQVDISRKNLPKFSDRLAEQEKVARALIAEYPTVPDGYESLLAIARDFGVERGRPIANELLRLPAPEFLKVEARLLLDRFDLVGRTLGAIADKAGTANLSAGLTGKPVILYSWSRNSAASMRLGKRLAAMAPKAQLVGVNIDLDSAAARQVAAREKLPGDLYYGQSGAPNRLAASFVMNRDGCVYFADSSGLLRDVQGLVDTREKLKLVGL